MVKSIVQPQILCVLGYIGMPDVSVCQSHSVSACTSTCLCRARTCAHRKPRCCYSNYTSQYSFFSLRSMQLRAKIINTQGVVCCARERSSTRRVFYQTFTCKPHSPCSKFYKQGKSARVVATTTDTSYLCLGSACHKPEQFIASSHTKVNQLKITNARLDHHQLTPTKKRSQ